MDILSSYRFVCTNAFWDASSQAYIDMSWNLFNAVFYGKQAAGDDFQQEVPIGALEVGRVLQKVARTRGFFPLGFDSNFFHSLKPLEQRLAIYLAKKFVSQKTHRRFVDHLAAALPIETKLPRHVRKELREAVEGLQAKGYPLLETFSLEQSQTGNGYVATFRRKAKPQGERVVAIRPLKLSDEVEQGGSVVEKMMHATGDRKSERWWAVCADTIGEEGVEKALEQLRQTCGHKIVKRPGGMLTKICKDIAKAQGKTLEKGMRKKRGGLGQT